MDETRAHTSNIPHLYSTVVRGFFEVSLLRGSEDSSLPSGPVAFGHHALPHANTRAACAPHALLHAHRVKTARTSPRECFTPPMPVLSDSVQQYTHTRPRGLRTARLPVTHARARITHCVRSLTLSSTKRKHGGKKKNYPGIDKHASQLSTSSDAPPTPPWPGKRKLAQCV